MLSHKLLIGDTRQTKLVKKAWKDSGKVYGFRKLLNDLLIGNTEVTDFSHAAILRHIPSHCF